MVPTQATPSGYDRTSISPMFIYVVYIYINISYGIYTRVQHTYTYITNENTYIHMCKYIQINSAAICTYTHSYKNTYMYIHVCIHTYIYICLYMYVYTDILYALTYVHVYVYVCIYTLLYCPKMPQVPSVRSPVRPGPPLGQLRRAKL